MSTIAAARQAIVSFSEVRRSISLRNMFLEADRLEERDELRLLLFHYIFGSGNFEEPGAAVVSCPTHEHARCCARQINGGTANIVCMPGTDRRVDRNSSTGVYTIVF